MKKELTPFLVLLFMCAFSDLNAQDIPNGDMEYWSFISDSNKQHPVDWITRNHIDDNPQAIYCLPVNDAFSGNSAIMLQNFKPSPSVSLASFIALGTHSSSKPNQRGIAFESRPLSLNFAYKYFTTKANPSGFFQSEAVIKLTRWDENTNSSKIIGEASLGIVHKTNAYIEVTLPIEYTSSDLPDSLFLSFTTPSNPDDQVRLTLDNIHLQYSTTGTDEPVELDEISLYPNPVKSFLNVLNPRHVENTELLIFDALGRLQVQQELADSNEQIDIAGLDDGFFYYQVRSKDALLKTGSFLKTR